MSRRCGNFPLGPLGERPSGLLQLRVRSIEGPGSHLATGGGLLGREPGPLGMMHHREQPRSELADDNTPESGVQADPVRACWSCRRRWLALGSHAQRSNACPYCGARQ